MNPVIVVDQQKPRHDAVYALAGSQLAFFPDIVSVAVTRYPDIAIFLGIVVYRFNPATAVILQYSPVLANCHHVLGC